jgi:hypothetical protein
MLGVFSLKKIAFVLYLKKNNYFAALFGIANVLVVLKVPFQRKSKAANTL